MNSTNKKNFNFFPSHSSKEKKMPILLYLLIVLICILLVWVLSVIHGTNATTTTTTNNDDEFTTAKYKSNPNQMVKRNCNSETIYAMDDEQCSNICRAPGVFRANNGRCVNVLALDSDHPANNDCDPQRGVLAYLVGDPQLGRTQLMCLSADLGIQPDSPNLPNILCKDGNININYLENLPQLNQCTCAEDKVLAIIPNNKTIRTHGQCVDKSLLPILQYNNIVYNPDIV